MFMVFVDLNKLDVLTLVVMMMVEGCFIDNSELVMVGEASCPKMNPDDPFVGLDLISPGT